MKIFTIALALFGVAVLGIVDIPKAVKAAFEKRYDGAQELSWQQEEGLYSASFKYGSAYKVANFKKDGTWTSTITELEIEGLDSCMVDFVKRDYTNSEIIEANLVETPGTLKYELVVRTSEEIEEEEEEEEDVVYEFTKLIFGEDCDFLGEEEYEGI